MKPLQKILLYSDAGSFSGAERYLVELARGLPRDRFRLLAVASTEPGADPLVEHLRESGLAVHRLPPVPTLRSRRALFRVWAFFLNHRRALLHFNLVDPRSCNGAMTAALLALRWGFVVTEHLPGSPFDDQPLPLRHRLARWGTRATIVFGRDHRLEVERRPTNRSRVVEVPNGLPDPGPPLPARRAAARAALGFPEHPGPLVGWVGRLVPQKNPDLFLEGVRRVAPRFPSARFLVIGDGPERGNLEEKTRVLGLQEAVRILGHRPEAPELIYGLDLLVNTSRYEGQPLTVLEALLRGVPVLAPRIPGMAEVVADQACGRIVAPEDGDHLGAALAELLEDPGRLAEMGRAARERASTLHSLEAMCRKTAAVYESLARGPAPPAKGP